MYTTDGGSKFSLSNLTVGSKQYWEVTIPITSDRVNGNFYAYNALTGELYLSTNKGSTFTVVSSSLPQIPVKYQLKSAYAFTGRLLLCAETGQLYTSTNAGANWSTNTDFSYIASACYGKAVAGVPSLYVYVPFPLNLPSRKLPTYLSPNE